jgi:membrane associated rhomboid family serine protease
MFLPIGDEPNPRTTPLVTYALIAVNVAVYLLLTVPLSTEAASPADPLFDDYVRFLATRFPGAPRAEILAQLSAYDLFTFRHGFRPGSPELSDLFASMFLHGGLLHLAGNMLFLYIYGDNVEARLGQAQYLLTYLGTGVLATVFFAVLAPGSQTPLVGASGAISGVLGCYFLWFPQNRIKVLVLLFYYFNVWRVPARVVLGFYLVLDNILPLLAGGGGGGVAHGAHIGGFAGGLGIAWLMRKERARVVVTSADAERGTFAAPSYERPDQAFHRAVQRGALDEAADLYARLPQTWRGRLDDEDIITLADGLSRAGKAELALAIVQRFIATRPASAALPHAHVAAGFILLEERGQLTAAREHFLQALTLAPGGRVAEAARAGLARVQELGPSLH